MQYIGLLSLAIQVYFCVHAYRNGKAGWIFIILFFPVVGFLIYLFAEYLPDMRSDRTATSLSNRLARTLAPSRQLERLKDEVALNGSVNNRILLAREYMNLGRFEEAIAELGNCLTGMYRDDPQIRYDLSLAYSGAGKYSEALQVLSELARMPALSRPKGTDLLLAKTYEATGELSKARIVYDSIYKQSVGEEIRCRYALLLKKMGRVPESRELFEEIVRNSRISPSYYRKAEREWISTARKELPALQK